VKYRALFEEGLGEDVINVIRDAAQRGWVAGSDRFRRQIEQALGRRVERTVRGRPRKAREEAASTEWQLLLLRSS
jgi:putative transposase